MSLIWSSPTLSLASTAIPGTNPITTSRANECDLVAQTENFSLDICVITNDSRILRLTLKSAPKNTPEKTPKNTPKNTPKTTALNTIANSATAPATPTPSRQVFASFQGDHLFWEKVWASPATQLSKAEQAHLRDWIESLNQSDRRRPEVSFVDFLANFWPADTIIEPLDYATTISRVKLMAQQETRFTMICEVRGQMSTANYTIDTTPFTRQVLVGMRDSKCRGRCGLGCYHHYGQVRHEQYTQECLDHDACRDDSGAILGVCQDEFIVAAASYVLAPDCPPIVIPPRPRPVPEPEVPPTPPVQQPETPPTIPPSVPEPFIP